MRRERNISRYCGIALAVLAVFSIACGDDPRPDPGSLTSPKARVRMKNGQRLQKELARVLAGPENAICQELGQYDCFGIHSVVLGNADAFGSGLYEPLPSSTSTTPMAIERVVLSGCSQRVAYDLANPGAAEIFGGLAMNGDGTLASVDDPSVGDLIDTLYRRGLSRRATDSEIGHLKQLYLDVENSGQSATPAQDWATLSCFSVLTTMEFLFY